MGDVNERIIQSLENREKNFATFNYNLLDWDKSL